MIIHSVYRLKNVPNISIGDKAPIVFELPLVGYPKSLIEIGEGVITDINMDTGDFTVEGKVFPEFEDQVREYIQSFREFKSFEINNIN